MWNSSSCGTFGQCSCSRTICREEPAFAGKVTCGVRNKTSGQSWRSNAVAEDRSVHRAKPEFKAWRRYAAQTSGRLAAKDFVPASFPPVLIRSLSSQVVHPFSCRLENSKFDLVYNVCNCGVYRYLLRTRG